MTANNRAHEELNDKPPGWCPGRDGRAARLRELELYEKGMSDD